MYLKRMSATDTVHCTNRGREKLTFAAQSALFPLCSLASIGQGKEALSGPPRSSSLSYRSSMDPCPLALTFPVRWSTQGMLTADTNWIVGGLSG